MLDAQTLIATIFAVVGLAPAQAPVVHDEAPKPPEAITQPPTPPPAPEAPQSVPQIIDEVFGPDAPEARRRFWCESRFRTEAKNGQYRGIAQMGAPERARFGHGPDARTQIEAAHAYFRLSGWQPWRACG